MNKPDNHIDNILLDFGNRLLDVANGKENPTMGELIATPKRQIEDFYRNKIPGKRDGIGSCDDHYNQAIDDMTAQFNSKVTKTGGE